MNDTPSTEHGARWRASLLAKAIEIAGTASGTPDNRTLVAMFDDELEAFAGYVLDASGRVDAGYRQGWEDVRDALGLRGNLPVSNAQYHASVLMPKLREVIRAATPVPVESLGRDAATVDPCGEDRQDVQTVIDWIFQVIGPVQNAHLLTDEAVAAVRRLEAKLDAMKASELDKLPAIATDIPKPAAPAPITDEGA